MIGRAAQGRPWIFREIEHYLDTGAHLPPPQVDEVRQLLLAHLQDHYAFYGEHIGVRSARKHIIWYTQDLIGADVFIARMNTLTDCATQWQAVDEFFQQQMQCHATLRYRDKKQEELRERMAA